MYGSHNRLPHILSLCIYSLYRHILTSIKKRMLCLLILTKFKPETYLVTITPSPSASNQYPIITLVMFQHQVEQKRRQFVFQNILHIELLWRKISKSCKSKYANHFLRIPESACSAYWHYYMKEYMFLRINRIPQSKIYEFEKAGKIDRHSFDRFQLGISARKFLKTLYNCNSFVTS